MFAVKMRMKNAVHHETGLYLEGEDVKISEMLSKEVKMIELPLEVLRVHCNKPCFGVHVHSARLRVASWTAHSAVNHGPLVFVEIVKFKRCRIVTPACPQLVVAVDKEETLATILERMCKSTKCLVGRVVHFHGLVAVSDDVNFFLVHTCRCERVIVVQ